MDALAQALKHHTLRKVAAADMHDSSAPVTHTNVFEEEQRNQYQSGVLDANLETYYDLLDAASLTFKTTFMPLSQEDARFFVDHYEAREQLSKALITQGRSELEIDDVTGDGYLTPDHRAHIVSLVTRLEAYTRPMLQKAPAFFVKFSSRSPKDAVVLQRARITDLFRKAYATTLAEQGGAAVVNGSFEDSNARIIAMLVAGTQALMMTSAQEAIELLRISERIYQDCLLALDQAQRGRFMLNMCVREWAPLHPGAEWRCFCRPGDCIITCISQYCYLAQFPDIAATDKAVILRRINDFYERRVAPVLRTSGLASAGFVCDISLSNISASHEDHVEEGWVLELNPLLSSTDGGLFSWQREEDLIMGRSDARYPVLRTVEAIPAGAGAVIASSWKWLLDLPDKEI